MNEIKHKLVRAVAAGQGDRVLRFELGKTPQKQSKKLIEKIKYLKNWDYVDGNVIHAFGVPMPGIATWHGFVGIPMGACEYRFRILFLDRGGRRTLFAIPVTKLNSLKELPGLNLTTSEMQLLIEMADDLRGSKSDREEIVRVKHPAAADLIENSEFWKKQAYDEGKLLDLLEKEPALLPLIVAVVDSQLRALKRCRRAPVVLFNFIPDSPKAQSVDAVLFALKSMTFSSASTCADQGPIELLVKDGHDLELWRNSMDRLVVLRTATGALLRPIFDELEERDRVAKCGGQMPAPLSSIPIIISRSVLNNKFAVDIETSKHTNRLALEDAECLRTAVSRLMSEKFIASAYHKWRSSMEKPDAAFRKAEKEWYNTLVRCLIDSLIHDSELHSRAQLLLMTEADRRAEAERQLQILLERGVELVSSPELYIKQIIDRPASKAEAERLLSTDAVAFRFSPTRGEDRGKELLAFSKSSLLRLLQRVSVTEKEYEAMLSECEKAGILGKKNWPINLGGETFNAVTFSLGKY